MAVPKPKGENSETKGLEYAYKKIRLRDQNLDHAERIAYEHGVSPLTARVLSARGFTLGKELTDYLEPTLKSGLPDPKQLKNLDKACTLLAEVVEAGGSIAICCDFDVDGLSGGSQVHHFFQACGINSKVFVPDRFTDGYGLNERMIRQAAEEGFALVLTIDYGTTNIKELELARELGMKTIVVDHHHVSEIPPCDVFINPQQKGCNFSEGVLCAAGLAWYLITALRHAIPRAKKIDPKSYLDLACLGTICDMVPLIGANRVIARRGLEVLHKTKRPGLQALKNVIGAYKELRCSHVSFGIGPRLNAAGRLIHGDLVVDLLCSDDTDATKKMARKLDKLNRERQDIEEQVKEQAVQMVKDSATSPSGIVVWDKKFHTGVIGIVAQRLVETFYRPAAVLGYDSGLFKGSVRGITGMSVVETLAAVGHLLEKFGGHEGAGGFSVKEENLEALQVAFDEECCKRLKSIETEPYVKADTVANLAELTPAIVKELKTFEPLGMGNPGPVVIVEGLEVRDVKVLKDAHLKVQLFDGTLYMTGMMWKKNYHPALQKGQQVTVACKPDINTFYGNTEMQLILQAVEAHETVF